MAGRRRLLAVLFAIMLMGSAVAVPASAADTSPLVVNQAFGAALITKLNQARVAARVPALQTTQSADFYAQSWAAGNCQGGQNPYGFKILPEFGLGGELYFDLTVAGPLDLSTVDKIYDELTFGGQGEAFRDGRMIYAGVASVSGGADCPGTLRTTLVVTSRVEWFGQRVSLLSRANYRFVSAEQGGAKPLVANRSSVGRWEQFDMVRTSTTNVTLRSLSNDLFVSAEAGGALPLIANRDGAGRWESFTLVPGNNGTVALFSRSNYRWVSADNAGRSPLVANRTRVGQWEQFEIRGGTGELLTPSAN